MPLILAGDRSGGNLAAVTAIRARDRSGPPLALQVLVYPVTDAEFNRSSYLDPENESLLTSRCCDLDLGSLPSRVLSPHRAQRLAIEDRESPGASTGCDSHSGA